MRSFLAEFREFAVKGNAMDMAVGVIVGAAFGKIVTSMVDDVFMPVLGLLTGGIDLTNYFWVLGDGSYDTLAAAREAGAAVLAYGLFVQTVVDFLIVSLAVFLLVTWVNRLRREAEEGPTPDKAPERPSPPEDILLLRQIRDSLAGPAS